MANSKLHAYFICAATKCSCNCAQVCPQPCDALHKFMVATPKTLPATLPSSPRPHIHLLFGRVRGISMPSGIGDEANLHIDYLPEVIIKQHQRTPQGHSIKVFRAAQPRVWSLKLTHNLFTKHVWHGQKLDHFSPTNWKFRLRIEDKAKQLICFSARRQLCTVHPTSRHTHSTAHTHNKIRHT